MKRIEGFDFARSLAILGMMLVNYKIVFTYGIVKYEAIGKLIGVLEGRAAAVFFIGMCLLIGSKFENSRGFRALSVTGKMAFSLYRDDYIFRYTCGTMVMRWYVWQ
ncbi:hypothetical protein [Fusibacter tunisiensis]|uniref:Membrane protein YeiB n=1 Tax=Fusibacter tunisiensis TaxID=1008308 RepID=A0ABS2MTN4_9FIRM|nr:hypothetical protein [Fusibacter tunisiensis]MBM7562743.1 putative membrane protein YeiB [Fusibacter tunisiensis]